MPEENRRSGPSLPLVAGILLPLLGAAAGWGAAQVRLEQVGAGLARLEGHHEDDVGQLRAEIRDLRRGQVECQVWRSAHEKEAGERWDRVRDRLGLRR